MVFELGKCYKHTSGRYLSIVGELNTTMYGNCLVAEQSDNSGFVAVGRDLDAAANWLEVPFDLWLAQFS